MNLVICLSLLGNLAIVLSVRWLQEAHLVNTYEASAQVEKHSSLELFSMDYSHFSFTKGITIRAQYNKLSHLINA